MPARPPSILEPLWVQFTALLPTRRVHHPLGCHWAGFQPRPTAAMTACWLPPWTPSVVTGPPARPLGHLDAGYHDQPCGQVLAKRGMAGAIATPGKPAPVQASRRWPIEPIRAWVNQDGKLPWCAERRHVVVAFWLAMAGAALVCGRLVRRAWACYRWDSRPRRRS